MSDNIPETRMIEKFPVLMTPTEKQRIKRAAKLEGISMSRYMVEASLRQAEVSERTPAVGLTKEAE